MPGLEDYASPILRCAVFRRLHPGAQIAYSIVPIDNAFPPGHTTYEGKATEAIKCEIVLADGTFIVAHKEIDTLDNRNRAVQLTPEELVKNETKCLGRALRDAGIPQRLSELKVLMQWISTLDGSGNGKTSVVSPLGTADVSADGSPGRALPAHGRPVPEPADEIDDADAGAQEPTPEQLVAQKFAMLNGADKAAVVKYARETLSLGNVMRSGEHADALMVYIDGRAWLADAPVAAEPDYSQPPLPEEESF